MLMKQVDFKALWNSLPKGPEGGPGAFTVELADKLKMQPNVVRRALHRLEQHKLATKQHAGVQVHWKRSGTTEMLRVLLNVSSRRMSTRADLKTLLEHLPDKGITPGDLAVALNWRQQRVRYLLSLLAKRGQVTATKELVGAKRKAEIWRRKPGAKFNLDEDPPPTPAPPPTRYQSVFAWAQGIPADCPL